MSYPAIAQKPETVAALTGAVVSRNRRNVLDGIDLAVSRGEIVTLIGPNGAGKSTAVRAILGMETLDAGTVYRAPGLKVGYLPQRHALDPALPLSVRRLLTLTENHPPARLERALDELRIRNLLDSQVLAISGGELQRVLLARALLREPDLLVLDEPTQNIDVTGAVEIYQLIARQRDKTGCGVLLVSHDLNIVMAATDKVVCVNGHVCCSGKPADVGRDRAFLELFGTAAAQTLTTYIHRHDHVHAPDGTVSGTHGYACNHEH